MAGRLAGGAWALLVLAAFAVAAPFPWEFPSRPPEFLHLPSYLAVPVGGFLPLPSAEALGGVLSGVALATVLFFAGARIGSALRMLAAPRLPATTELDAAFGLGALGLSALGLGFSGLLYHPVLWTLAVAAFVVPRRGPPREPAPALPRGWLGAAWVVLLGWWALNVLNPEAGVDAYVYHLRLPSFYLLRHRVFTVWHQVHGQVPQVWEMLVAFLPAAVADSGAQALSAGAGLMALHALRRAATTGVFAPPASLAAAAGPFPISGTGRAATTGVVVRAPSVPPASLAAAATTGVVVGVASPPPATVTPPGFGAGRSTASATTTGYLWVPGAGRAAAAVEGDRWALLLFSSPLLVSIGTSAYSDTPLIWLGSLSFFLAARGGRGGLMAAGLALGLACSVKYAAFPLVVAAAAWLGWKALGGRGSTRRTRIRSLALLPVAAVAVLAPWLAWNVLATGNPVHPFLGALFPWALKPASFAAELGAGVFRRGWALVLASPWNAYVRSGAFLFLSPWFVVAAPRLLFARRSAPGGGGIWLGAFLVAWSVFMADERFALPALPVLVIALTGSGFRAPRGAGLALLLALNAWGTIGSQAVPVTRLQAAAGLGSRQDYLARSFDPAPGYAEAARWLNANTPSGERVLFVAECRSHLVWRECVHEHVIDYPSRLSTILSSAGPGAGAMGKRFRQLGIRRVLHLPGNALRRLEAMPRLFPFNPALAFAWRDFWGAHAVVDAAFPGATVYRLEARADKVGVMGTDAHASARPGRGTAVLPGLPGVQELIAVSLKRTAAERGAAAAAAEAEGYVRAYPRIGAVRDLRRLWRSASARERRARGADR